MNPYVCNVFTNVCPAVRFHRSGYLQQILNNTPEFVLLLFKRFFFTTIFSHLGRARVGHRNMVWVYGNTLFYVQLLLLWLRCTTDATRYNRLPRCVGPQHAWKSGSAKTWKSVKKPGTVIETRKSLFFFYTFTVLHRRSLSISVT